MSETAVDLLTVRRFMDLFARIRKPYIHETAEAGWRTISNDLTEGMVNAHLHGILTFGVRVDRQRGGGRIAGSIALEVDFGTHEDPVDATVARILGGDGLAFVRALHDAGADLQIPPEAWCVSWSGGRSLHGWLTPREPIRQAQAYAVARALQDGIDRRIASCGLHVCTAWPTNASSGGMGIRLPWGRHQRTGEQARFVDVDGDGLHLRNPFPHDAPYLAELEARVLDPDVLTRAADLVGELDPVRLLRSSRPSRTSGAALPDGEQRIEQAYPVQVQRIARPCVLHLIEHGVPETMRHDFALMLRAEAKACGLTQEETWPLYRRYAAACTPPWEEADARRDLQANWTITDPALRHLCPGPKDPSALTRYMHKRFCVKATDCGWRRAGAGLSVWETHLSTNARTLYIAVCLLEAEHSRRPGDNLRTTGETLMGRCGLGHTRFTEARKELREAGLLEWERAGIRAGAGTPSGGVHSVYRRIIPVPDPPETT